MKPNTITFHSTARNARRSERIDAARINVLSRTGRAAVALLAFGLTAALSAFAPQAAQAQFTFHSVYSFFGADGQDAQSNLFQASDGNLYGTTVFGGKGIGAVYRISPDGAEDVIHVFGNISQDGSGPNAVIQASDGNLYGTTQIGGANNQGSAFKIGLDGTYTQIHSFGSVTGDALQPSNHTALLEADGDLYGVAASGGQGTFYGMTFGGAVVVCHVFKGGSSDGSAPNGTPILASDGSIYGAAALGGPNGAGVIYKMSGSGFFNESVLYAFKGGSSDGQSPSVLIQASDGNLYGITQQGGASHNGMVFKLTLSGAETVLHSFAGGTSDGSLPESLVQGTDGKLYGVCRLGGAHGSGIAFRMSLSGAETLLYSFGSSATDPGQPLAMMQDTDGNFYGIGLSGGVSGNGSVFKMTTSGTESLLHSFPTNSGIPFLNPSGSGLLQAADGSIYGTTYQGGVDNKGTVFQVTPDGHQNILHSFSGKPDGDSPGALVQDSSGNLYGVTGLGGTSNLGTIFKITPGGTETVLHSFTGSDGVVPDTLLLASDGNLYGTCAAGGASGTGGTVFKISPTGGALTSLYNFPDSSTSDGHDPVSLIQASDGNFYGTTELGGVNNQGIVFRVTTSSVETPLYFFTGGSDGSAPIGGLVQGPDGALYGTAEGGGSGFGSIFKITLSGTFSVLYDFLGSQFGDGAFPEGNLVVGPDGNLYGATVGGGTNGDGVVFEASRFSAEQVVHEFNGADGKSAGPLLLASDGSFYGMTGEGGFNNVGTIFVLEAPNPVPVLSSISPSKTGAGGPAFTLVVTGSSFLSSSTVDWNGTALTTTFVSATELKATVPASLIATPGTASVTVVNPAPGGGTSNSLTFTIAVTTVGIKAATLVKNSDGSYTATMTLKNTGFQTANSAQITKSSLGSAATTTSLPVSLGNIAAGASVTAKLHFPSSAGTSGKSVKLAVSVAFTGGSSNSSLSVTLP